MRRVSAPSSSATAAERASIMDTEGDAKHSMSAFATGFLAAKKKSLEVSQSLRQTKATSLGLATAVESNTGSLSHQLAVNRQSVPCHGDDMHDPMSGLRLASRTVSAADMKQALLPFQFVPLPQIQKTVERHNPDYHLLSNQYTSSATSATSGSGSAKKTKSNLPGERSLNIPGDWFTIGVVVEKSMPRKAMSGERFLYFKVSDLKQTLDPDRGDASSSSSGRLGPGGMTVFVYGDSFQKWWYKGGLAVGKVVVLLNPKIVKPNEANAVVALDVDLPGKLTVMGTSLDYKQCIAERNDGKRCTVGIDSRNGDYCEYHLVKKFRKGGRQRMEFNMGYGAPEFHVNVAKQQSRAAACEGSFSIGGQVIKSQTPWGAPSGSGFASVSRQEDRKRRLPPVEDTPSHGRFRQFDSSGAALASLLKQGSGSATSETIPMARQRRIQSHGKAPVSKEEQIAALKRKKDEQNKKMKERFGHLVHSSAILKGLFEEQGSGHVKMTTAQSHVLRQMSITAQAKHHEDDEPLVKVVKKQKRVAKTVEDPPVDDGDDGLVILPPVTDQTVSLESSANGKKIDTVDDKPADNAISESELENILLGF